MKHFLIFLFFVAATSFVAAQAPQAINYQAIARDAAGNPIPNQAIGVQFRILQGEASGRQAYAETFTATTNALGLFNLQIGRGTPASGTFAGIDWGHPPCFLEVAIDPTGGRAYQVVGTSEMLSVPYALKAGQVEAERQVLSLEGNRLSISEGNTVTLLPPTTACDVLEDCSDAVVDTRVWVYRPGYTPSQIDQIHMDLGTDGTNGPAVPSALVLRKNAKGNTMLEIKDIMGGHNTFVGKDAGNANATNGNDGIFNTAIGSEALKNNTTGLQNTASGSGALRNNSTGRDNTAIGTEALRLNISGHSNTAIGALSLQNNDLGTHNTAVGFRSLHYSRGVGNTALGAETLYENLYNSRSTAIGFRAMSRADNNTNTTPYQTFNTAVGYEALYGSAAPSANTGISNTAIGDQTLWLNESGSNNTALGREALYSNVTGDYNTASGFDALANNTAGRANVANGAFALLNNKTGTENTASGFDALRNNTGSYNTAYGKSALQNNLGSNYNTANGTGALSSNTTGGDNTAVGASSLDGNTTGSRNTAIGFRAGVGVGLSNLTNASAIGANAVVRTDNSMILGDVNVNVGIGPLLATPLVGPQNKLEIDAAPALNASGLRFRQLTNLSPAAATNSPKLLSVDGAGDVVLVNPTTAFSIGAVEWAFLGNAINTGDFLGTTNTEPLVFKVNSQHSGFLHKDGPTFLGYQAGLANINNATPPLTNTAIGFKSLTTNVAGTNNTAVGYQSLLNNTVGTGPNNTGSGNTAVGSEALRGGTTMTGSNNTAVGLWSLHVNTTGYGNAATGAFALEKNTTGFQNTANGWGALGANLVGIRNTAIGASALTLNTATDNTATGAAALQANTTGTQNTATGSFALNANIVGTRNTASGYKALTLNTASDNTAMGANALATNAGGTTTGFRNTATGSSALNLNATGARNTATGAFALRRNLSNDNTAVGSSALENTVGNPSTTAGTGYRNTAIGSLALLNNVSGNLNTAIGYGADIFANNLVLTNASAIGANAKVRHTNAMILGDNDVNVGIGLSGNPAGPANKLEISRPAVGATPAGSGLSFRNLTAAGPFSPSATHVLSVNATGEVILVPCCSTGGGGGFIGACPTLPALTSDAGINLGGNNFYFGGSGTTNTKDNVGIGISCGSAVQAKLHVNSLQSNAVGSNTGIFSFVSNASSNAAIIGRAQAQIANSTLSVGVQGDAQGSTDNYGIQGSAAFPATGVNYGVFGVAQGAPRNYGGRFISTGSSTVTNYGIYAEVNNTSANNWAGYFRGNVEVTGALNKGGGNFKIDHPLDPANQYLYHSFVESPDMMNIYNGNTTTDQNGEATVQLPAYFEALNFEFRYQLTCIGTFAQAIVSEKVQGNRFKIRTDKPSVEVSWQVTGVRKDAWANANRTVPETNKTGYEKGKYLHPELFGQPAEMSVDPARANQNRQQPEAVGGAIRQ